jgi:hypothetical protein
LSHLHLKLDQHLEQKFNLTFIKGPMYNNKVRPVRELFSTGEENYKMLICQRVSGRITLAFKSQ